MQQKIRLNVATVTFCHILK